jgi:predicted esterase
VRQGSRLLAGVVTASVLGVAGPAPADAPHHSPHHAARPDLTVTQGTVTLSGSTLSGSFSVKDKGHRAARKTSAALFVRVSGQDRLVARLPVKAIRPGRSRTVTVSVPAPAGLPAGALPLSVCADSRGRLEERSEKNNCRTIGTVTTGSPVSSVPTRPVPFAKNTPLVLSDARSDYWVYVPTSYDSSHQTPMTLFVWLHGCGGSGAGDIYTVSPGGSGQDWLSVTVGGREGDCWDVDTDSPTVLAAIADVKTHFNVNPRRVVIGGYSSGGDLAYRTAFFHANTFAGLLAENTSPFRDTGSSQSASLAAAAWKFPVVHLAHLQDMVYPVDGVEAETAAMTAAGFPVTLVERDGGHYDDPGDIENGHAVPGTDADLRTYLLPALDLGWLSPG